MEYLKLETEKYMRSVYKRDAVEEGRIANQKAVRDFCTFLFGVILIPIALQAPNWLPALRSTGILRIFN